MQGLNKVKKWSSLLIMVLVLGCCINSSAASSLVLGIAGQKEAKTSFTMIDADKLQMTVYSYSKYPVRCTVMGNNTCTGNGTQIMSLVYSGSATRSLSYNNNYSKIILSGYKNGYKVKGSHATAKLY